MSRSLQSKVALVTGARAGLGAAIVLALAELGATVIASGRKAGDCAAIVAAVVAKGGKASELVLDVGDLAGIPQRAAAALALHGRLDILVNNAATIEPMAKLSALDPLAFDRSLTVNVSGPAALVAALWPALEGGRVVNVVSGAANHAMSGWSAYCVGKAALMMLTRSIELEGADIGLRGFAFAPGLVDTDMQAAIRAAKINQISDVPRENLQPPERPARVIAWLASGAADDLAGQYVDIRQEGLMARVEGATSGSI